VFVGLVHDHSWEPPDQGPRPPRRRRLPHVPWQPFAWFAAFCWLMVVAGAVGGLPGYVIVLLAVGMGCWRIDRWLGRQYWQGLREYQR
jgi:hypothetical protein